MVSTAGFGNAGPEIRLVRKYKKNITKSMTACESCGYLFFYSVTKCPICSSSLLRISRSIKNTQAGGGSHEVA